MVPSSGPRVLPRPCKESYLHRRGATTTIRPSRGAARLSFSRQATQNDQRVWVSTAAPLHEHVAAGGFAIIARRTAFDEQGSAIGVGDIRAECEKAFENLTIPLKVVAGLTRDTLLVEVDAVVALG